MILITDVISQSSNFCWIVLDETTYYISAFAVDSNGTIIDVQTNSILASFDRKPDENTLVYWKLDWNLNDSSWNNRNWTWNVTFETKFNQLVAKFSWSQNVYRTDQAFDLYWSQNYTLSIRVNVSQFTSKLNSFWICESWSTSTQDKGIEINPNWSASWYIWDWNAKRVTSSSWIIQINQRYNLTSTFDWSTLKIYVNGELKWSVATSQSYNFQNPTLMLSRYHSSDSSYYIWYASRFILQKNSRSWTEVLNYVNKTKWRFGL